MSRFMSSRHAALKAYVPGEQPRQMPVLKLNTNESPFPPSAGVLRAAAEEAGRAQLYSDPTCRIMRQTAAAYYGVSPEQITINNGSDETLSFAFQAFGDESHPFAFPEITYGFYPVFAQINHIPYRTIPLKDDFTIDPKDYEGIGCNIAIANPNAPTGLILSVEQIERIAATNPDHMVIIDEAYVDFGGQTCIPLLRQYDNLLITRTFSKSFSLAGARLGMGIGSPALIQDLETIKYSVNPYSVNRMTLAAGAAALEDGDYYRENCNAIIRSRMYATEQLRKLGFTVLDSSANFVFATHPKIAGERLYQSLKERGILVRWFDLPKIRNYNRITIGTKEQMDTLLRAIMEIMEDA